jgi:hypothetical protein
VTIAFVFVLSFGEEERLVRERGRAVREEPAAGMGWRPPLRESGERVDEEEDGERRSIWLE